jgi:peptidoglycan-N-acetylglucosamine deacetylase
MPGSGSSAPRVAATFDMEHPSREHHDPAAPGLILDALRDVGVRATFFVQGRWARAYPDLARRVVDEGHLLGNHSHHHARMNQLTDDGLRSDIASAHEALLDVTGADARPWFRCPFGDGRDDPRVMAALTELGYRNVHWDVDSIDYAASTPAEGFAERITAEVTERGDGAVVLWHTWPGITGALIGATLSSFLAAGATLVGVDEIT